ncbi:MAG: hypothetical protein NXY57DRAFT_989307, partial [Lentinula lateritia]
SLPIAALSLSLRATLSVTPSHIFDSTATTTFHFLSKTTLKTKLRNFPSKNVFGCTSMYLPETPGQTSRYGQCWYRRCQRCVVVIPSGMLLPLTQFPLPMLPKLRLGLWDQFWLPIRDKQLGLFPLWETTPP